MVDFTITPEMNKQLQELEIAKVNKGYKKTLKKLSRLELDSYKQDTYGLSPNLEEVNPTQVSDLTSQQSAAINKETDEIVKNLPKDGENAIGEYRKTANSKQLDYVVNEKQDQIQGLFSKKTSNENDKLKKDVDRISNPHLDLFKSDKADKEYQRQLDNTINIIKIKNELESTAKKNGIKGREPEAATENDPLKDIDIILAEDPLSRILPSDESNEQSHYTKYNAQTALTNEIASLSIEEDLANRKTKYETAVGADESDRVKSENISKEYTTIQTAIKGTAKNDKELLDKLAALDPPASPIYDTTDIFPQTIDYSKDPTAEDRATAIDNTFFTQKTDNGQVVVTDQIADTKMKQGLSFNRFPNTDGIPNSWDEYFESLGVKAKTGGLNYLNDLLGQGMGAVHDLWGGTENPAENDPLNNYINKAIGILNDKYSIDAMDNAFDVYLIYIPDTNLSSGDSPLRNLIKPLLKLNKGDGYSAFFKNLTTPTVFGARVTGIQIPQIKLETISYPWLSRDIVKPGKPKRDSTSSFTFRLDQNLFYANIFEQFAGLNDIVVASSASPAGGTTMAMSTKIPINTLKHQTSTTRANAWEGSTKIPHLCLYVRLRNLAPQWSKLQQVKGPYRKLTNTTDAWLRSELGTRNLIDINQVCPALPDDQMPGYLFEDVNILGSSDISLDVGSGDSPQEMTVNFTFRRCIKTRYDVNVINSKFNY